MNYPEYIYKNYEIVEKEICGEMHYGLVRIYSFLGLFTFKRSVPVSEYGRVSQFGRRWWNRKHIISSAIRNDNDYNEYLFERKMTK